MEPYTAFASCYDSIMDHVDYNQWYQYIRGILYRYVKDPLRILELGCGTGKFGAKFSNDGIMVYGMDRSIEMLRVAHARAYKNFRVFCADMMQFSSRGTFDFIFSVHDTINYFIKPSCLQRVLRSVRNAMDDNSIFMFDITTDHNIKRHFDGKSSQYTVGGTKIEWHNYYDKKSRIVYSTLVFIGKDGSVSTEQHVQKIYTPSEIKSLLKKENLMVIDVFGDYTFAKPEKNAVMINFVTRKA